MKGCFSSYYDMHCETLPVMADDDALLKEISSRVDILGVSDAIYALAIWKDRVDYVRWSDVGQGNLSLNGLLEIRVFGENGEIHASRDLLDGAFAGRVILDGQSCPKEGCKCPIAKAAGAGSEGCLKAVCALDEVQLLDFSPANKSPKLEGVLGKDKDANNAIRIRNYLRYDEEGIAQVADFRIAGFCKGIEVD